MIYSIKRKKDTEHGADGLLVLSLPLIGGIVVLNRNGIYSALPYALLGIVLWGCLHCAGLQAILAGVIVAAVTPTRS